MFETLESRQLMSATLLSQTTTRPPTQPTVVYAELSPEQAVKASAQTGSTLSDSDKAAIAIAISKILTH